MGNEKCVHQVVTKPYSPERFNSGVFIEPKVSDIEITGVFFETSFLVGSMSKSNLTQLLIDLYNEKYRLVDNKPNIFFHLSSIKKETDEVSQSLQYFTSDVRFGNLNSDGFYRTVIDGKQIDYSRSKRYIGEILRLYRRDVVDIKGIYSGYVTEK
ncbi:MAG: hypothetical protein KIH89_002110 [Candidatus Shapirobacteria bacterium]|nr:hypothetical protein [Candidatus Shapirobacteria bacterium]